MRKWCFAAIPVLVLALIIGGCNKPVPAPTPPAPAPAPSPTPAPTPTVAPKTETAADFYVKNVVNVIVPFGAGGGTDYAGRLYAAYWPEASGGAMIVKNKAGGGSIPGTNMVYTAKPDGLTIGLSHLSEMTVPQIFGMAGVEFDLMKTSWVGFFGGSKYGLGISSKLPYSTLKDLQGAKGLKLGATGAEGAIAYYNALAIELFGLTDAKIVPGYAGTADIELAIMRGELDGYVIQAEILQKAIDKGIVKPSLVTLDFTKDDYFPNTPAIPDLIKLTPTQEVLLRTAAVFTGGKCVFGPPGLPADRLQFLRDAFTKIIALPGFLQQAKLQFPVWTKPLSATELETLIKNVMNLSKDDMTKFKEMGKKYLK